MRAASFLRRWWAWLVLAVVLASALTIATQSRTGNNPAAAQAARVTRITSEIRCPTCKGLSAAVSDAETAQAIRVEVAKEVAAGRTDGQILASMRDKYGSDILLRPPASGFDGLVWGLPVVAFVLVIAGLALAFRRWRATGASEPTAEDRARVAQALAEGRDGGPGGRDPW